MNKAQYRSARSLCRDNGRHALRWLPAAQAQVMDELMFSKTKDRLAERAECYRLMGWSVAIAKNMAMRNWALRAIGE